MNNEKRIALAKLSLEGLSVGDAFGEKFFIQPERLSLIIENRTFAKGPWRWTDDTAMALSVVNILFSFGEILPGLLASAFSQMYADDPGRGYGAGAHRILNNIGYGMDWKKAAALVFDGQGSFGNGGAMRSAPIGAFFWDDYGAVVKNASASAQPTHFHLEGRAGAIGIAIATAYLTRARQENRAAIGKELIEKVIEFCPESLTREGLVKSLSYPLHSDIREVAAVLGNGGQISAQDTVPICVWAAAKCFSEFEEAMWETVSVLGDRDRTCAIVGGMIAPYLGYENIPKTFLAEREELPALVNLTKER